MTQAWEYAEFVWAGGMGSSRQVRFTGGGAIEKIKDGWEPRMEILGQLGTAGWELVGYATGGDGKDVHILYTFKRPKAEAAQ